MSAPALPGILADIERVAGRDAALRLARSAGGSRINVPAPARLRPEHPLARALSPAAAAEISRLWAGERVDVPHARGAVCAWLLSQGRTVAQVAAELKMARRSVRRHRPRR